ncbi:MAG TPA: aromatic-ring-hydroxylating dioxygenase subunit beta [Burkholderiaceae bacterium]|nr:aromatic-ring-hydroxylating dioxygenase subunit beta [Burkholderiaceae bacterium]
MNAATERELFDFVAHEARLIDARRFDEWLALFADNGRYWIPLQGEAQAEGAAHNALADEDRLLLALRIERLKNPRAHSQHPPSRCQHILQQPTLVQADDGAGRFELRTPFMYVEARGERQLTLSGTARHRLVRDAGQALRIELKRVDLLNADVPLPAIQLFP